MESTMRNRGDAAKGRRRRGATWAILLPAAALAAIRLTAAAGESGPAAAGPPAPEGMVAPKYSEDGKLMVPENYRGWVFIGASIGLNYTEEAKKETGAAGTEAESAPEPAAGTEAPHYNPGMFHHTYMQPEAYAQYRKTGEFPEKTMMILEIFESVGKVRPDTKGFSQGRRVALEVSVKDRERVEEGWAYYNFALKDNRPAAAARPLPKGMCYKCHETHANEDRVFTQFYPVLREAREAREAEAAGK